MQIFVAKSDLSSLATLVSVAGAYEDTPLPFIDRNFLGALYTPLAIPASGLTTTPSTENLLTYQLVSDWRTSQLVAAITGESQRRIYECFSDFMQRNANSDVNRSITLYGANSASWPSDAQARKAEGDRGWTFITQVRQTANAITVMPNDPTADVNGPPRITPVYIDPVY
jgi:hypothetical protein